MVKEETQHLELQDNRFTWLHTAEVQHKVMDSQVQTAQELKTEQELAQAEAVRVTGRTHGAQVVEAAVLTQLENTGLLCPTLEDTLDTSEDQEAHQKDLQVADQDGQTQTILEDTQLVDEVEKVFTELQAEAEAQVELLVAVEQTVADKVTETTLELTVQMEEQTLAAAAEAAAETLAVQESAKLPIG